jgi:Domain of unknown function (DUF3841)
VRKPRPGTLRLWTFQEQSVCESLCDSGTLYAELDKINDPDFLLDCIWMYDWMREQMAQRLRGYRGHYPWWAWLRSKPDLRKWAWIKYPAGTPYVRLELALEPERVLLSQETAWWCGLGNHSYVGIDAADYAAWNAEMDANGVDETRQPLPEPWRSRVTASWERMFDVEALVSGGEWSDVIQATFERLDLADVVGVTAFVARGTER